jgi:hypothetical protein
MKIFSFDSSCRYLHRLFDDDHRSYLIDKCFPIAIEFCRHSIEYNEDFLRTVDIHVYVRLSIVRYVSNVDEHQQ